MTEHKQTEVKQEFNQSAGMYVYGLMSGATIALGMGLFSLAMYLKTQDSNVLWAVGAAAGILGGLGGFFEVGRSMRAMVKASKDDHPPAPKP